MNKRTLLIITACLVAGTAGYSVGSRIKAHSLPPTQTASTDLTIPSGRERKPHLSSHNTRYPNTRSRTAEQLANLKSKLRKNYSSSPSALHDWILRGETAALLATLSPEELNAFYLELQPAENEVNFRSRPKWQSALTRDIIIAWAQIDPASASFSNSPMTLENTAFQIWLRRDPQAIAAWLQSGSIPPEKEHLARQLQRDLVTHLAETNFHAAKQAIANLSPEEHENTLNTWSRRFAHDPEKREEVIALARQTLAGPSTDKLLVHLVKELAIKSPSEASDFVEALNVSADQKHSLSEQVLGQWAKQAPQEAFAAWADLKEQEVPKPLLAALDVWSLNSPGAEQALDWAMNLQPGPAKDALKTHLLTDMAQNGRIDQATALATSLENPVERLRHLKRIRKSLNEANPTRSADWLQQFSPTDRAALETPLD